MANATTLNRLGALVVGLSDRLTHALEEDLGLGGTAPAALLSIGTRPGLAIAELGTILRLSHSATVRLVERLETAGAVERGAGDDKRQVLLTLSAAGKRRFARMLERRRAVLGEVLAALGAPQQRALDALLVRLLGELPTDRDDARHICRLCEHAVCRERSCPVGAPFVQAS